MVLRGAKGMRNFAAGEFFLWGTGNLKSNFDHLNLFQKLKTTFCEYWTSIKIKISMICVYKEYEAKIKMVLEQWLLLQMKFLFDYIKIVI